VALNLSRLHPDLKYIALNVPHQAELHGFHARVTSGYRSYATQAKLYKDFIEGRALYPANPPGQSMHERGLAIDVVSDNLTKLVSLLTSTGLSWAGPRDEVHFQMNGPLRVSQGRRTARSAYVEDVGSSIPSFLTYLPIIGTAFSAARDPIGEAKFQGSKLIDVILGFL